MIERCEPRWDGTNSIGLPVITMVVEPGGRWVLHSDHLASLSALTLRADTAERRVRELEEVAKKLLGVMRYPDNGHHHCRWCNAGTANEWKHAPGCFYALTVSQIDEARAIGMKSLPPPEPPQP